MDDSTIEAIARAYREAEKERRRIRPPSAQYPGFSIDDAYAVQRRAVALKLAEGRILKGCKIGLTSRAMQSIAGSMSRITARWSTTCFTPTAAKFR